MSCPAAGLRHLCLILLLLSLVGPARAAVERLPLALPSAPDFALERFGQGGDLLLWLPSQRGFGKAHRTHAQKLAATGYEVWLADLHDAYFVEPGRRSIESFPLEDVVALVDAATRAARGQVVLISSSRGAQLALIAAREWQLRNPSRPRIAGLVLMHAYLYAERPAIGTPATYLPIVNATNLPVFLLDAQYSTKSARLLELAREIESGGSQVFTQIIRDVEGGFYVRDERDLGGADLAARKVFAQTLGRAVQVLKLASTPAVAASSAADTRLFSRFGERVTNLTRLQQPLPAPRLELEDFAGPDYRLQRQRGRVVLVNFWASWCKPCVEEIPSLHRLKQSLDNDAFDIVTVNVGESRERIGIFLERVPVELPLLLDSDSRAARDWRVYVYPSSYLVDRDGQIRYAYLGALEWDSAENITIIRKLLQQR